MVAFTCAETKNVCMIIALIKNVLSLLNLSRKTAIIKTNYNEIQKLKQVQVLAMWDRLATCRSYASFGNWKSTICIIELYSNGKLNWNKKSKLQVLEMRKRLKIRFTDIAIKFERQKKSKNI